MFDTILGKEERRRLKKIVGGILGNTADDRENMAEQLFADLPPPLRTQLRTDYAGERDKVTERLLSQVSQELQTPADGVYISEIVKQISVQIFDIPDQDFLKRLQGRCDFLKTLNRFEIEIITRSAKHCLTTDLLPQYFVSGLSEYSDYEKLLHFTCYTCEYSKKGHPWLYRFAQTVIAEAKRLCPQETAVCAELEAVARQLGKLHGLTETDWQEAHDFATQTPSPNTAPDVPSSLIAVIIQAEPLDGAEGYTLEDDDERFLLHTVRFLYWPREGKHFEQIPGLGKKLSLADFQDNRKQSLTQIGKYLEQALEFVEELAQACDQTTGSKWMLPRIDFFVPLHLFAVPFHRIKIDDTEIGWTYNVGIRSLDRYRSSPNRRLNLMRRRIQANPWTVGWYTLSSPGGLRRSLMRDEGTACLALEQEVPRRALQKALHIGIQAGMPYGFWVGTRSGALREDVRNHFDTDSFNQLSQASDLLEAVRRTRATNETIGARLTLLFEDDQRFPNLTDDSYGDVTASNYEDDEDEGYDFTDD